MTRIIVDTCVLVSLFDQGEPGHSSAARLGHHLIKSGVRIHFPMHALFEVSSALKRKNKDKTLDPYKGITETNPLLVDPVPIDQAFFNRYFDPSLPHLKAGDGLFLAMAKKDGAILITEDKQLYNAAKVAHVEVYSIEEYLLQESS